MSLLVRSTLAESPAHLPGMTNPNRTPAGVPTGGQFAASTRAEASIDLEDLDVYGNTDECVAIEAHLTSVDDDGYCNHCGSDDPDPRSERHGVSDAYPNGRCTACGSGLDETGRCYQSDCTRFDGSSPCAGYDDEDGYDPVPAPITGDEPTPLVDHSGYPEPETDAPATVPQDAIKHPEHRAACLAFAEQYADRVDLTDPDDFEREVARVVAETGENEADLRERLTREYQPRNVSPLDANVTNRANGRAKVGDSVIFEQPMHGSSAYEVLGKMHRRDIIGADENGVQWAETREVEYVLKNLENGTQTVTSLTDRGWRRIPAPEATR